MKTLSVALLLAALGVGPPAHQEAEPPAEEDWEQVWSEVERLRSLPPGEAPALEAELQEVRDRHRGGARGELLGAWLDLRAGGAPVEALPGLEPWPFDGPENWIAAEVLAPGGARTRALLEGLADGRPEPSRDQLMLAWTAGLTYAGELLWMEEAVRVQRALHRRYGTVWSVLNLAFTLHRSGSSDEADALLGEYIAAAEPPAGQAAPAELAELWNNRGLIALGRGRERQARDCFGRALALGSTDSALILARIDLSRGNIAEARAGFRGLLLDVEPHAWALRGWGVALLSPDPGAEAR